MPNNTKYKVIAEEKVSKRFQLGFRKSLEGKQHPYYRCVISSYYINVWLTRILT